MVGEKSADHLRKPFSLFRDRLVPSPQHFLLDLPELRPHAVAPGSPHDKELSLACLAADKGEAQKVEGLRFAEPR